MIERGPDDYYWPHHLQAGLPPPDDPGLDLATRCSQCKGFRHFGQDGDGAFVDDVFMCGGCVRVMDGYYRARRYWLHDVLRNYLTWRAPRCEPEDCATQ